MMGKDVLSLHPDLLRHAIADAAGVVSHASGGSPIPADMRMKAVTPEVSARIIELLQENSNVA